MTSARARWCLGFLPVGFLLFSVLAAVPNSPLSTPLPRGASPPGWAAAAARAIGLAGLSRPPVIAIALPLMALLVAAFGVLAAEALRGRVALRPVLAVAAVSLLVAAAAPLLLSRDAISYGAYARLAVAHHRDPYAALLAEFPRDPFVAVTSTQWLRTPAQYGPAFLLPAMAVARAWAGSPGAVLLAFKVLAALGIGAATVGAVSAARSLRPERTALAAVLVGVNPVLIVHTVGGGHVDALIAGLLAWAVALAVRPGGGLPRRAAVTLLLTLAVLVKVVLVPALALWLWWTLAGADRRSRGRAAAVHAAAVVVPATALLAPFADGPNTFRPLATSTGIEGWASGPHLVAGAAHGLAGAVLGAGAAAAASDAVLVAFGLAFVALLWRLAVRARPPEPGAAGSPRLAGAWSAGLLLLALCMPYLLPWYAAWFAPSLALAADEALLWIGAAVSGGLALTLIPADPAHGPSTWGVMMGVHYLAAPVMLVLLGAAARRAWRGPSPGGAGSTRQMPGAGRTTISPVPPGAP